MMRTPLPLGQQILLDIIVPPIGTCVWWVMSRGWASAIQLGKVSDTTKKRQKSEFWIVLVIAYLVMCGITIYGLFR